MKRIFSVGLPILLPIAAVLGFLNYFWADRYQWEWGDYGPIHYNTVNFIRDRKTNQQVDTLRFAWEVTHERKDTRTKILKYTLQVQSKVRGDFVLKFYDREPQDVYKDKARHTMPIGKLRGTAKEPVVSEVIDLSEFIDGDKGIRFTHFSLMDVTVTTRQTDTEIITQTGSYGAFGEVETLPDPAAYNLRGFGVPIDQEVFPTWNKTSRLQMESRPYYPKPKAKK